MGIFLLVVGALGLVWCLLPTFMYGIIGLGNLTGIAVFIAFILLGLFRKEVVKFRKRLQEKKAGRILVIAVRTFIILFCALVVYLTGLMFTGTTKRAGEDATLVVLGCLVRDYGPSLMLRERLDKTYEYLTEHPDAKCVLSGGQGKDEPVSEAFGMFEYLTDLGIDPDRLYMEDKSLDTQQNIEYTYELIEREGLNKEIAILSNEFHLYRAGQIAEEYDLEYGVVPAQTHWFMFLTYYIRELYGILAECVLHVA